MITANLLATKARAGGGMTLDSFEFAVVDVETTGLFPGGHDRIVEIAVLRLDSGGRLLGEYVSLVNPQRDLGPTYLHGVTAAELIRAPQFEEIIGDVLSLLAGGVFVAHNASFDMRFVRSEMDRAGCPLPRLPCLCTMALARRVDAHIPSRQLAELCLHFGIDHEGEHSAYHDARATAELLKACTSRLPPPVDFARLGVQGEPLRIESWPSRPPSGRSYRRELAAKDLAQRPSYIATLVSRLPADPEGTPELDAYYDLLDRVLEDRRVTETEAAALGALAGELGLSAAQAAVAHHAYLRDLVHVALGDGIVTDSERADLDEVRRLLSIGEGDLTSVIDAASPPAGAPARGREVLAGKSVCFTGTFSCRIHGSLASRSFAQEAAARCGMVVKSGVTKSLDFLVVADPDSMSGKARKARDYGVRILAEPVFWRLVGITVD